MSLSFPLNPVLGQEYTAPNGTVYVYDGVKWMVSATVITGAVLTELTQDRMAEAFIAGNDTNTGITFTYDDANGRMNASVTGGGGSLDRLVNNGHNVRLLSSGILQLPTEGAGQAVVGLSSTAANQDNNGLAKSFKVDVNGRNWHFDRDGKLTLPLVAGSGTSIGTAFNTNPPNHTVSIQHNGGVDSGSGGELKFDYGSAKIKVVRDAGTTHSWTFASDGTTTFPTVDSGSLTVQGSEVGTLDSGLGLLAKDNVIIRSNFLDTYTAWTFDTDGNLTLPAGGDIKDSTGASVLGGGSSDRLVNSNNSVILGSNGFLTIPNTIRSATGQYFYATSDTSIEVSTTWPTHANADDPVYSGFYTNSDGSSTIEVDTVKRTANLFTAPTDFVADRDQNGGAFIAGMSQRNSQQIEVDVFANPDMLDYLANISVGQRVIVTYSTLSTPQTFTSILSQAFTNTNQGDPITGWTRMAGRIDGTVPAGYLALIDINFPIDSTSQRTWTFGGDGVLTIPGGLKVKPLPDDFIPGAALVMEDGIAQIVSTGEVGSTTIVWTEVLGQPNNTSSITFGSNGATLSTGNSFNGPRWNFTPDGALSNNGSWTKTKGQSLVTQSAPSVVWTGSDQNTASAKLTIQVEGAESGDNTGWHTQVCEALVVGRGTMPDPVMTVYGTVHTSVAPLVTFTVQRNTSTHLIEVVGIVTGTASGTASVKIYSVEMSTND